jgi:hypothetical protein
VNAGKGRADLFHCFFFFSRVQLIDERKTRKMRHTHCLSRLFNASRMFYTLGGKLLEARDVSRGSKSDFFNLGV